MLIIRLSFLEFCNSFDEVHAMAGRTYGVIVYINQEVSGQWGTFTRRCGKYEALFITKYHNVAN